MAPNVGLGTQGPDQQGWGLWLVSVAGVLIAALFVAARLAQRCTMSQMGLDDYMIIAALVASGLLSMFECQAVVYGYGQKWANLEPSTRITARKWFYGAQIMYKTVLMLNKIAIVCLYYRIFAVASLTFRRVCHAVNAFIIAAGMAFIIGTVFQCQPISLFWDKSIKNGRCFSEEPWWISYSVVQIVTDGLLLALPVQQVLSLRMNKVEKIGLVLVFATGLFVTFASIFRATTVARSAHSADPTQGPIPATVWSVIEANAGIVCACLPMLRQPFLRLFSPLFGFSSRSSTRGGGPSQQRSYVLSSRSNPRASAFPGGKHDPFGDVEFGEARDRDSEERIIEMSAGPPLEPGEGLRQGIMVKNEITVMRNGSCLEDRHGDGKRVSTVNTLGTEATQSIKDDKESTYMHV